MAKKKSEISISPLHDKVVIKPLSDKSEKISPAGIIIPETVSKEKPESGVVVAVGPGGFTDGKLVPMTVKVGDKVIFGKYGFDEIKIDDEEYYILSESGILATIN